MFFSRVFPRKVWMRLVLDLFRNICVTSCKRVAHVPVCMPWCETFIVARKKVHPVCMPWCETFIVARKKVVQCYLPISSALHFVCENIYMTGLHVWPPLMCLELPKPMWHCVQITVFYCKRCNLGPNSNCLCSTFCMQQDCSWGTGWTFSRCSCAVNSVPTWHPVHEITILMARP